jgi:hypothetical protein
MDQTIRYTFTAETGQAQRAIREMSQSLQSQREAWKQNIYDEKARRAEAIAQIKKQELAILSLSKEEQKSAREKLKIIKAEESARSAAARQGIASEQARLRRLEISQVGVSGLDRMAIPGGLLPGFGRLGAIAGVNIPAPLMDAVRAAQGRSGGRIAGNQFAQAASSVATAQSAMGGLGTAAMGLTGVLGTAGLLGAMALLTAGAGKLGDALNAAGETTKGTIISTTAFARDFKLSRDEARKFAIANEKRIEGLGAALPISSTDINNILRTANNSGAVKLAGTKEIYQREIIGDEKNAGAATRFALLRQSLGQQVNDAQVAGAAGVLFNRKTKLKDLNTEFFKISGLRDELKKQGFDSLKGEARLQAINKALANLVPQEAINEMQGTLDATISSVNDRLFSPRTGFFGALRELESLGGKTFYAEVSRALGEGAAITGKGSLAMIGDAFSFTKRGGIGEVLGQSLNGLLDAIIANPGIITAFTSQLTNEIGNFFGAVNWGKLALSLGMLFIDVIVAIPAGLLAFGGGWIRTAIGTIAESLMQAIKDLSLGIASLVTGIPRGVFDQIGGAISGFFGGNAQAKYAGTAIPAAGGYMPINQAIARELQAKPASSGLVVANSSEYIFQPSQLSSLLSRTASPPSTAIQVGGITIHQQPGEDGNTLADRVISRLDSLLKNERNYRLN